MYPFNNINCNYKITSSTRDSRLALVFNFLVYIFIFCLSHAFWLVFVEPHMNPEHERLQVKQICLQKTSKHNLKLTYNHYNAGPCIILTRVFSVF